MDSLRLELAGLLNKFSVEGQSNTPDFILSRYLLSSLSAFDDAVRERDKWYGIRPDGAQLDKDKLR